MTAPPASADTPGCVTRAEYKSVHRHYSQLRVRHIFDTPGKLSYQSGSYKTREYNTCTKYGYVAVSYRHGRVISKTGSF